MQSRKSLRGSIRREAGDKFSEVEAAFIGLRGHRPIFRTHSACQTPNVGYQYALHGRIDSGQRGKAALQNVQRAGMQTQRL